MATVSATLQLALRGSYQVVRTPTAPKDVLESPFTLGVTNGTGAYQANRYYATRFQSPSPLFFPVASLTGIADTFGSKPLFDRLMFSAIRNNAAVNMQVESILLENVVGSTLVIPRGGILVMGNVLDKWNTDDGINDVFTFSVASGSLDFDWMVMGHL